MLLFVVIVALHAVFAAAHSHPQRRNVENYKRIPTKRSNLTQDGILDYEVIRGIFNTKHELAARNLWGFLSKKFTSNGITPKLVGSKTVQSFFEPRINPVPLNNLSDSGVWVANIDIGNPPTGYRVAIETGSSIFWVYLGKQRSKTRTDILKPGALYNFNTVNQNGLTLKGVPYEDTIEIGTINDRGRFVSIVGSTNRLPYDGVLGLTLAASPYAPGGKGFVQEFLSNYATHPIFALYLGATDPQIHIGGADAGYYDGEIEYHKVIMEKNGLTRYWEIGAGNLHVRGATIVTQGSIIDSGTRFIYGPPDQVKAIYHAIRGTKPMMPHEKPDITFPCRLVPMIALSWNDGNLWEINPKQFSTGPKSKNSLQCQGVIRVSTIPDPKRWIVGTSFLTGVYTVFVGNQKEPLVGFGHLQNGR